MKALEIYIENITNSAPQAARQWQFSQALEQVSNGNAFNI